MKRDETDAALNLLKSAYLSLLFAVFALCVVALARPKATCYDVCMNVTIELPPEVERALHAAGRSASQAATEALAVSLFRDGQLSHAELGRALALDRFETDALLKRHQVTVGGPTIEDLEADRQTLDRLLGPVRP